MPVDPPVNWTQSVEIQRDSTPFALSYNCMFLVCAQYGSMVLMTVQYMPLF